MPFSPFVPLSPLPAPPQLDRAGLVHYVLLPSQFVYDLGYNDGSARSVPTLTEVVSSVGPGGLLACASGADVTCLTSSGQPVGLNSFHNFDTALNLSSWIAGSVTATVSPYASNITVTYPKASTVDGNMNDELIDE